MSLYKRMWKQVKLFVQWQGKQKYLYYLLTEMYRLRSDIAQHVMFFPNQKMSTVFLFLPENVLWVLIRSA